MTPAGTSATTCGNSAAPSTHSWADPVFGADAATRSASRSGDTIDFWRVEKFEQDRLLRLAAEMKLPGRAWLQFEVDPDQKSGSTIRQTAIFDPAGVAGLTYWYSLWPIHDYIFRGMLARIAAASATT